MALGVFEGHMAKMADGFKAIRRAEAELAGEPAPDLTYFGWKDFTDDEWDALFEAICEYQDHGPDESDMSAQIQSKIRQLFN